MRNKRYNKVEERVMTDVIDRLTAKCNRLKNDNDYLRATNEVLSDGNIRINKVSWQTSHQHQRQDYGSQRLHTGIKSI